MFETMAARAALPNGTFSLEIVFGAPPDSSTLWAAGLAAAACAVWGAWRRRRRRLAGSFSPISVAGGGAGQPTG